MHTKLCNKLVRSRIPEIIKSDGKTCVWHPMPGDAGDHAGCRQRQGLDLGTVPKADTRTARLNGISWPIPLNDSRICKCFDTLGLWESYKWTRRSGSGWARKKKQESIKFAMKSWRHIIRGWKNQENKRLINLSANVTLSNRAILSKIFVLLWFSYIQAISKEIGFHLQIFIAHPGTIVPWGKSKWPSNRILFRGSLLWFQFEGAGQGKHTAQRSQISNWAEGPPQSGQVGTGLTAGSYHMRVKYLD